jgi:hypothetical protein
VVTKDPEPLPAPAAAPDATAAPAPAPSPAFDPSTQGPNLPPGAMLINPGAYVQSRTDTVDSLADTKNNIAIQMLVATDRGGIKELAAEIAQTYKFVIDHIGTVPSAGKDRDAAWFSGTTNNVALKMLVVLYDGPTYRLVVIGAEPAAIWNEEAALQFFAEDVAMP